MFRGSVKQPVLVSCTDSVGSKVNLAFLLNKHDTVGIDCVAMSINDMIVQGAEPLFFLDYIGINKAEPEMIEAIVTGVVDGCHQARCSLLGGETAELPDLYKPGEYDLVGFGVGVVERGKIIDGSKIVPGDVVIGMQASGIHSNGYTLVRKVLLEHAKMGLDAHVPDLGCTLGEELLRPTLIYSEAVRAVLAKYTVKEIVKALANITGGGLPGNIPRMVPPGMVVHVKKNAWQTPPIFSLIQEAGNVAEEEMYRTFNMGIGMTLICPAFNANAVIQTLKSTGCEAAVIGEISKALDPEAKASVKME